MRGSILIAENSARQRQDIVKFIDSNVRLHSEINRHVHVCVHIHMCMIITHVLCKHMFKHVHVVYMCICICATSINNV